MSNDMKLIMESWRSQVLLNEQQLIEEQLLLEGFLDSLAKLSGDVKNTFTVAGQLMKDRKKIPNFVALLDDEVITPSINNIKEVLKKLQDKFSKDEDEGNKSIISGIIKKVNDSVDKVYEFVKGIPRATWKKAAAAIGFAVAIKYFAFETFVEIPIEQGIEKVIEYFNEELMNFLNSFLGEALVEALSSTFTGGIATLVSVLSKMVKGTSFISQTLAPAIEPFQAGKLSLSRLEEQMN